MEKLLQTFERLAPAGDLRENPRMELEQFFDTAAGHGFSFEDYPELAKFWGGVILRHEMDAPALRDEMERISRLIFAKLSETPEEKTFLAQFQKYELLLFRVAIQLF